MSASVGVRAQLHNSTCLTGADTAAAAVPAMAPTVLLHSKLSPGAKGKAVPPHCRPARRWSALALGSPTAQHGRAQANAQRRVSRNGVERCGRSRNVCQPLRNVCTAGVCVTACPKNGGGPKKKLPASGAAGTDRSPDRRQPPLPPPAPLRQPRAAATPRTASHSAAKLTGESWEAV